MIAPLRALLDEKNLQVMKEQMNSPCVEEVAAFDKFIEFMDDPVYDVVVFDTAPTGHTIRLLELPSGWASELDKGGSTCIGPSSSLQGAKQKYETAIAHLQDSDETSFIFVLKPEHSSILETKRSSAELSKLGIKTTFFIVNGILPEAASTDRFFKKKWDEEQAIVKRIEDEFEGKKLFYPLRDSEVSGLPLLESVGKTLYENLKESTVVSEEAATVLSNGDDQRASSTFEKRARSAPLLHPSQRNTLSLLHRQRWGRKEHGCLCNLCVPRRKRPQDAYRDDGPCLSSAEYFWAAYRTRTDCYRWFQ